MIASTVSPIKSKLLYGTRPIAPADGDAFVLVKVRLLNSRDEAVVGVTPELFADRAGVEIVQPGPTDSTGMTTGYIKATTPGPVTIKARVYATAEESAQSSEQGSESEGSL